MLFTLALMAASAAECFKLLAAEFDECEVITEMCRAGFFRLRGVLVGTTAFQCYAGILGVRLPATWLSGLIASASAGSRRRGAIIPIHIPADVQAVEIVVCDVAVFWDDAHADFLRQDIEKLKKNCR